MIVISVVVGVLAIHQNQGYTALHCFVQKPECSTAVSTYALVAFGALAFSAAIDVGSWARMTLEHERAPVLSIEQCKDDCAERRCEAKYIDDANIGFVDTKGDGQYQPYDFDVHNIGKIALGALRASVRYRRRDGTQMGPFDVGIGAVAAGARMHGRLFIDSRLLELGDFEWVQAFGNLPRLGKTPQNVTIELFTSSKKLRVPLTEKWRKPTASQRVPPRPQPPED